MGLRPLNAFSQEESINQEFGRMSSTLPWIFSFQVSARAEACGPLPSRGLPFHTVSFLFQSRSIHFSAVGGLRKDRMEEDDEKAK